MENLERYCGILEAVLFSLGEPTGISALAKAIGVGEIVTLQVLETMKADYEKENRGIRLLDLDGQYQLCTKKEYYENLITVVKAPEKPHLTETVMETLAIVAYRQPVTKSEVSRIRGVSSDHAVSKLVEYGLIKEAGRLNAPGRPMLFVTTEEFLRRFGMESVDHLPSQDKIVELDEKLAGRHVETEGGAEEQGAGVEAADGTQMEIENVRNESI